MFYQEKGLLEKAAKSEDFIIHIWGVSWKNKPALQNIDISF